MGGKKENDLLNKKDFVRVSCGVIECSRILYALTLCDVEFGTFSLKMKELKTRQIAT